MLIKDTGKEYLVFSETENLYYWQIGDNTSQPFKTLKNALAAYKNNTIKWRE